MIETKEEVRTSRYLLAGQRTFTNHLDSTFDIIWKAVYGRQCTGGGGDPANFSFRIGSRSHVAKNALSQSE